MTEPLDEQEKRLQDRIEKDQNRLKDIQAKRRRKRRRDDTRMKILAGNSILKAAARDPGVHAWLRAQLERDLTRPHDRALYERCFPPAPNREDDHDDGLTEPPELVRETEWYDWYRWGRMRETAEDAQP